MATIEEEDRIKYLRNKINEIVFPKEVDAETLLNKLVMADSILQCMHKKQFYKYAMRQTKIRELYIEITVSNFGSVFTFTWELGKELAEQDPKTINSISGILAL